MWALNAETADISNVSSAGDKVKPSCPHLLFNRRNKITGTVFNIPCLYIRWDKWCSVVMFVLLPSG